MTEQAEHAGQLRGSLLIHSRSRNVCYAIQRGIEKRYDIMSHVIKVGTRWQVRIDSPMKPGDGIIATAYADAVIDVAAEFKLDTDRL